MPPRVARLNPDKKPTEKPTAAAANDGHKCVMCLTILDSKQELQDHFRLHANGTIDMKGRPVKKMVSQPINKVNSPHCQYLIYLSA